MKQMLGLVVMLCLSTQALAHSLDWDGTWAGSWCGQTAAKIIISGGNVLEYDYRGNPQKGLGQTIISGNTLTFGTPPGFVITLTKRGPTTAAARYHGTSIAHRQIRHYQNLKKLAYNLNAD
jgi:hypothetical protein